MTKLTATVFAILILSTATQPANAGLMNWVAAGAAGVAVVAFAPTALGFGAAGILAGSPAAAIMSTTVLANGGGVAAGSVCAILQSAGAVGLTAKAAVIGGTIGAGAGVLLDDEEK